MITDKLRMTKRNLCAICFGINFLLALIIFLPFMLKDNGAFSLGTDYDAIYMPIYNSCRESILHGEIFWDWDFDLGTDFVGSNSFYALGSPFFWISLLFYKVDYLYLGGWMFILKYAVAGMTAGLYMERFVEKKPYVIIGSVLYAFSGFQSANLMMGGFHDVVAVFPLMLYGVEALVVDKKRGIFAVTVCLNALVNYYFFVGEVIFIVLYFVLRFLKEGWKKFRSAFACMGEGIVGILMSGGIFYPAIIFIMQNPRSGEILSTSEWFITDRRDILQLFRSLFFPGEMMQQWSCVREYDWSSSSAYLPMVGIVLVLCYILGNIKKVDWLKRIILVSFIFMAVPVLGSIFTFMTDVYCRWYYMPLLLFALASVKVLENISQYKITIVALVIVVIMIISIIGFGWWNENFFQVIYVRDAYVVINIIGVSGVVLTGIIPCALKNEKNRFVIWTSMICLFALFTTAYTCKRYQDVRGYEVSEYEKKIAMTQDLGSTIDASAMPYRLYNIDNVIATSSKVLQSGSNFSNVQGTVFELWDALGEKRRVVCPDIPQGYYDLVGAKYRLSSTMIEDEGWEMLGKREEDTSYYLYAKGDANTIGVTYNTYMLKEEFLDIPKENRAILMQSVIVVDNSDEEKVVGVLKKYNENTEILPQQNITDFCRTKNGFACLVDAEKNKYLLFSIPYAKGWSAYINGEKKEIINANGFMAISVSEGVNNIEMKYFNTDVLVGLSMTIVGIIVWSVIVLVPNLCRRAKMGTIMNEE